MVDGAPVIRAAGTVPWRRQDGVLQVAVVHRPKYDDWSWPKGKLDPGESEPAAAVRETLEETGLTVRLGIGLAGAGYPIADERGRDAVKEVSYWAAGIVGGDGQLAHEVDQLRWLEPSQAAGRLTYARDREQLRGVVRAEKVGTLATWPLIIVRHAHARSRGSWKRKDHRRPLDETGAAQAQSLVPVFAAFGVTRVVTSFSARCADTVTPYARQAGVPVTARYALSEESYASQPGKSLRLVDKLFDSPEPTLVCTHGPILPALFGRLARRVARPEASKSGRHMAEQYDAAAQLLAGAADPVIGKSEMVVCHVSGRGAGARIVSASRHHATRPG